MLDHLSIQCADFDAAAFYDAVLVPSAAAHPRSVIGYGTDFPCFWIATTAVRTARCTSRSPRHA